MNLTPQQINNMNYVYSESTKIVRPEFNNLVRDNTEKTSKEVNIKVNSAEDPDFLNSRSIHGFNSIAEIVSAKSNKEIIDHLTIDKLNDPTIKAEEHSVGLPMDNLIIDTNNDPMYVPMNELINNIKENTEKESVYTGVKFDNLVSNYTRNYDNKFGVQSIPIDMDRSMLPKPVDNMDLHINKDNKSTNNRRNNNWFSRLIEQRGEEYITSGRLTVEEVSKNAERIIDDMIGGKIDYDKYGKYIIMPVIIETLINYCSNKLAINRALQFSLGYVYNDYVGKNYLSDDPERYNTLININDSLARDITQSIAIVNQDIATYNILFNKLSYVNNTKNVSGLYSLINELNIYKKQMKKRY